jgi:hypothetical protein
MKYKRLASKLGVKKFEPGSLISKMHELKGMPKKKHKFGTEKGLKKPFEKEHKKNDHDEDDFKKHKEVPKSLDKKNFDGEKSFKKHKCMLKHVHTKSCK